MIFLLKSLLSVIKILHSENNTNSIAFGTTFGLFLGLNPIMSLQAVLLLIISLIFSVQIGIMLISWAFFSILYLLAHNPIEKIGYTALSISKLDTLWETLFNIPGFQFTFLNNSLIMGGFICSIVLSPFIFLSTKTLLRKYRHGLGKKIENSNFLKFVKATKLYSLYESYSNLSAKVS